MFLEESECNEQAEKRIHKLRVQSDFDTLSKNIAYGARIGSLLWDTATLKSREGRDLYGSISTLSFDPVIFPVSCSVAYPEMS
jgi:hypothetical protein